MEFEEHARATLIAYYEAHRLWKNAPESDKPAKKAAKEARAAAHSKLITAGELLKHKPP